VEIDPLASMRCWAITVEIGGREFEIPALPAADWWPVLADATALGLVDLLKSTDGADLDAMLLSGEVTSTDMTEALMDAISEATGRTFHASFVLATVAGMHWPVVGGQLARDGFRWDVLPIGAALDAVHAVIVESFPADKDGEKARERFLALLEDDNLTKPGGKKAPSKRVLSEFEAMAGPMPAPAAVPGKANAGLSASQRPRTRTQPRQPLQGGRSAQPKKPPGQPGRSGPRASS
jgi:hypothetical protein